MQTMNSEDINTLLKRGQAPQHVQQHRDTVRQHNQQLREEMYSDAEYRIECAKTAAEQSKTHAVEYFMSQYYKITYKAIIQAAYKELVGHKFTVDAEDMEEFRQEAAYRLYRILKEFKPVKLKHDETGEPLTDEEGNEIEIVYGAWHELPAKLLFAVLRRRLFTTMRSWLNNQYRLNRMLAADAIAQSHSEEELESTLLDMIEDKAQALRLEVPETIDALKHILSPGEYAALSKWVIDGNRKGIAGKQVEALRVKISSGTISPDELMAALPKLQKAERRAKMTIALTMKKLA